MALSRLLTLERFRSHGLDLDLVDPCDRFELVVNRILEREPLLARIIALDHERDLDHAAVDLHRLGEVSVDEVLPRALFRDRHQRVDDLAFDRKIVFHTILAPITGAPAPGR